MLQPGVMPLDFCLGCVAAGGPGQGAIILKKPKMKNPNKQTKPLQTNQTPLSNLSQFKALPEVFPVGMLQPGISEACKLVYIEGKLRNLKRNI